MDESTAEIQARLDKNNARLELLTHQHFYLQAQLKVRQLQAQIADLQSQPNYDANVLALTQAQLQHDMQQLSAHAKDYVQAKHRFDDDKAFEANQLAHLDSKVKVQSNHAKQIEDAADADDEHELSKD